MVSAANSLIGTSENDGVGAGEIIELANGNFVVASPGWSDAGVESAGAVTFESGTSGLSGPITAANSLVGTHAGDFVGASDHVVPLANGNYIVASYLWNDQRGAATLGDGKKGVSGEVSDLSSLIGSQPNDQVGYVVGPLPNGNYVVDSLFWNGNRGDGVRPVTAVKA